MRQIWDLLRSVSVHFGSPSQIVLKLILKNFQICPIWGQSDPILMGHLTSLLMTDLWLMMAADDGSPVPVIMLLMIARKLQIGITKHKNTTLSLVWSLRIKILILKVPDFVSLRPSSWQNLTFKFGPCWVRVSSYLAGFCRWGRCFSGSRSPLPLPWPWPWQAAGWRSTRWTVRPCRGTLRVRKKHKWSYENSGHDKEKV